MLQLKLVINQQTNPSLPPSSLEEGGNFAKNLKPKCYHFIRHLDKTGTYDKMILNLNQGDRMLCFYLKLTKKLL